MWTKELFLQLLGMMYQFELSQVSWKYCLILISLLMSYLMSFGYQERTAQISDYDCGFIYFFSLFNQYFVSCVLNSTIESIHSLDF